MPASTRCPVCQREIGPVEALNAVLDGAEWLFSNVRTGDTIKFSRAGGAFELSLRRVVPSDTLYFTNEIRLPENLKIVPAGGPVTPLSVDKGYTYIGPEGVVKDVKVAGPVRMPNQPGMPNATCDCPEGHPCCVH